VSERSSAGSGRRILVAVSAGIAAFKVPELVREFVRGGDTVRCIATPDAARFVSALVLETLSGAPVGVSLFASPVADESPRSGASQAVGVDHIEVADWADVVVLAPATADVLARLAAGMANDFVSVVLLATRAPILVAPAMNVNMWEHPATQANMALLGTRGINVIGPEPGELACGWEGLGRMSEPSDIAAVAESLLTPNGLAGHTVLVTAGGTSEPIDAVRSVTNRSSGKMGFAVAAEAALRGADVVLVAGPTPLVTPPGVRRIDVQTALEMRDAVFAEFENSTITVMAAAVADFRAAQRCESKIKKEDLADDSVLTLELTRNPDILAELCQRKGGRVVIGFAAESHDLMASARRKIARKGCDLLVANNISSEASGFDADDNAVVFVWPDGQTEELPSLPKRDVAAQLLDRVAKLRGGHE
jgi:phosphopantothenoylcysteine decarboxylase/phosphopantothenate--cysteine ligase